MDGRSGLGLHILNAASHEARMTFFPKCSQPFLERGSAKKGIENFIEALSVSARLAVEHRLQR